ncbi:MAG: class I SAM-dependent methyltransferase [Phycisphaerae bacterium]
MELRDQAAGAGEMAEVLGREDLVRAVFGGRRRGRGGGGEYRFERVVVRAIELRGERMVQVSRFDGKKDFSKNVEPGELVAELADVLAAGFANVHVTTRGEEIDFRLTKKGQLQVGRRKREPAAAGAERVEGHNRVKEVPLPEGKADHVLQAMGIMTREQTVRPTMRAKFTQINEFLRVMETVLGGLEMEGGRELQILDCGCGSSYLTIAAHHWLNDVKRIPARVLGVDVNEEVIRKSVEKVDAAGGERHGLEFAAGRIGSLEGVKPDIVLALHACDTATDDAIAQAIRSEAKVLLAVPCCHRDLNGKIEVAVLKPIERHGILRQRFADLATDAFRALVLRIMGYRADVIEFISPEHTARNLMIRAVRTGAGSPEAAREYREFKAFTGVTPYLEKALGEEFAKRVAP